MSHSSTSHQSEAASSRQPRDRPRIDRHRVPRCLPRGKFDQALLGYTYWAFISVQQTILEELMKHREALMSEAMLDDMSWLSHNIASGDPLKKVPCRPTIILRVNNAQSAHVVCTATFGKKPISSLDSHIQQYAVALQGTDPWPTPDSPVVRLNEPWPTSPSYVIAAPYTLLPHRVKQQFRKCRYRLSTDDINHLQDILTMKGREIVLASSEDILSRNAQFPRVNREPRWSSHTRRHCATSMGSTQPSHLRTPLEVIREHVPTESTQALPTETDHINIAVVGVRSESSNKSKRQSWAKRNIHRFIHSKRAMSAAH